MYYSYLKPILIRRYWSRLNKPRKGVKHYLDLVAELKALIDNLNFATSLVVVEGRHDEEALRRLGLRSPVARFCDSGLPFFAFV